MITIIRKFISENDIDPKQIIEHNFDGLKDYKPGRHVNKSYFYGIKVERNTDLELNTLRIKK